MLLRTHPRIYADKCHKKRHSSSHGLFRQRLAQIVFSRSLWRNTAQQHKAVASCSRCFMLSARGCSKPCTVPLSTLRHVLLPTQDFLGVRRCMVCWAFMQFMRYRASQGSCGQAWAVSREFCYKIVNTMALRQHGAPRK